MANKKEFKNLYCHLLLTERDAEKKQIKACGTASKCHPKLEWTFMEEER